MTTLITLQIIKYAEWMIFGFCVGRILAWLARWQRIRQGNRYKPDYCVRPGSVLAEYIEAIWNGSDHDFSIHSGIPLRVVRNILSGEHPIDERMAIRLEESTTYVKSLWLNMEKSYREGVVLLR